jgi:hemerythrin-like domain-containing protein
MHFLTGSGKSIKSFGQSGMPNANPSGEPMNSIKPISRRGFLVLAGAGIVAGCSSGPVTPQGEASTAIEILDRQHGLLERAIAILEEIRGGMDARMDLPPEIITETAGIIRRSGVDYHQKMEDKYIFPALDAAKKMGGLIGVLREQHEAGARLIEVIKGLSVGFSAKDLEKRRTMSSAIHHFSRMYRAHTDREETLIFPLVRQVTAPKAFTEMNAAFQKAEKELQGQDRFEETIQKISGYENTLGIGDLAAFTPRVDELS